MPWRRAWHPTPVFLPGESHGQSSLEGYRVAKSWKLLKCLSRAQALLNFQQLQLLYKHTVNQLEAPPLCIISTVSQKHQEVCHLSLALSVTDYFTRACKLNSES